MLKGLAEEAAEAADDAAQRGAEVNDQAAEPIQCHDFAIAVVANALYAVLCAPRLHCAVDDQNAACTLLQGSCPGCLEAAHRTGPWAQHAALTAGCRGRRRAV